MNASRYLEFDKQIIDLYQSGMSARNIARKLDLKENGVSYRLKVNGIRKRSISEANVGRLKSEEHRHALSVSRIRSGVAKGSRNPRWMGGVQSNWERLKNSNEYKLWRLSVYRRDKFLCQHCKIPGKRLQAHHILFRSTHPELTFSIENGLTLCIGCHKKVHSGPRALQKTQRIARNSDRKVEDNPQPSLK